MIVLLGKEFVLKDKMVWYVLVLYIFLFLILWIELFILLVDKFLINLFLVVSEENIEDFFEVSEIW